MLSAMQVGKYILDKDTDKAVFTRDKIIIKDKEYIDGNIRINEYLHLAQILYMALENDVLFMDDLYAYDGGVIIMETFENYSAIVYEKPAGFFEFPKKKKQFVNKIYEYLKPMTTQKILNLSHMDKEWQEKSQLILSHYRCMNPMLMVSDYRQTYVDVIRDLHKVII